MSHAKTRASQFRGVTWDGLAEGWSVDVWVGGQSMHVATLHDKTKAAQEYDRAATELLKDPVLNFFPDGQLNPFRLSTDMPPPEPPVSAITTAPAVKTEAAASSSSEPAPATKVQKETATAVIKYRGVNKNSLTTWRARVHLPGNTEVTLGYYETPAEAARAHDRAARKYFVDPIVNFLDDGSLNPDRHKTKKRTLRLEVKEEAEELAVNQKPRKKRTRAARQTDKKDDGSSDEKSGDDDEHAATPSACSSNTQRARSQAAGRAAKPDRLSAGRAKGAEVWVELKTAVFRRLTSVDGPALPEDEASKYRALLRLLNKPTPSLRGFVEDVVLRSGFSAEVADRAAGLLADMAVGGELDD